MKSAGVFAKKTGFAMASALAMVVLIAGPGCKGEDKPKTTQVAVKVNGDEISVHQLNSLLAKAQKVPADAIAKVRADALEKLVDQQLAYEQAVEKKLDRNPDVVMAIEMSKREIIARAYLEQVVAGLSPPTEDEVRKYYVENPALFSARRVYSIQEITVEHNPELLEPIRRFITDGKSVEDMAAWLKERNAKFRTGAAVRAAEQIGLELLPKVADLKDGQATVIEGPQNYLVVRVISSQSQPVAPEKAYASILQFLHNVRVQEALNGELGRLRKEATIEYQGEFESLGRGVKTESATAAPALSDAAKTQQDSAVNLEKGVQGLN